MDANGERKDCVRFGTFPWNYATASLQRRDVAVVGATGIVGVNLQVSLLQLEHGCTHIPISHNDTPSQRASVNGIVIEPFERKVHTGKASTGDLPQRRAAQGNTACFCGLIHMWQRMCH